MSALPKRVLNDTPRAIDDALIGLAMSNKGLVLLEDHRILLRRDHFAMSGKVKLIGGGGGGHEPAASSFVGPGMLTAAVIGDIFTSPPTNTILRAIRELGVAYEDGILLIIANYMGDRLNFGLAMERARSEGIYVRMLVVGDDCSLTSPSVAVGRRGLAGIILIMKIAGAMAEEGRSLDDIFTTCQSSLSDIATIGFSLRPAVIPGTSGRTRFSNNEIALGVGFHNNVGVTLVPMGSAQNIAATVLSCVRNQCCGDSIFEPPGEIIVLVNNFGGSSKLEEHVFAKEVLTQLSSQGCTVARFYCGTLVSMLDTSGFSVTLLKPRDIDVLPYLDAPTSAPAWPRVLTAECVGMSGADLPTSQLSRLAPSRISELNETFAHTGPKLSERTSNAILKILIFASEALVAVERMLNYYDEEGGNGGFGTSIKRGAAAMIEACSSEVLCTCHPYALLHLLSALVVDSVGGTTGALYAILFTAAAKPLSQMDEYHVMDAADWINCYHEGIEAIRQYGLAKQGDGTMLDPMMAAESELLAILTQEETDLMAAVERAAVAAETVAVNTVDMCGSVGRSSYSPSKKFRDPDPGAHCVAVWMRAVCEGIKVLMEV